MKYGFFDNSHCRENMPGYTDWLLMSTQNPKKTAAAATNRKALRNFHVEDRMEAGLELKGTEVKSIRDGKVTLDEGFAELDGTQLYLRNVYIEPYSHGNIHNHEPDRPRRLLLHKAEIIKLIGLVSRQGYTLIPMKIYFKRGRAKVVLGLCKAKLKGDKREDLKKKEDRREARQALDAARRR